MYEFLDGKLAETGATRAVVDVGGVGYVLVISGTTSAKLPKVGHRVRLLAHLVVTDGEPRLFGFATHEERDLFRLLISVSGVGPSTAMSLLSTLAPAELVSALAEGNDGVLRQVRGIGAKTASRLVLELKDVATRLGVGSDARPATRDAVSALMALGFQRLEAERLVAGAQSSAPNSPSEELVKHALAASRSR